MKFAAPLLSLLLAHAARTSLAIPDGAPVCTAGTAAAGPPHRGAGFTAGDLSSGGITVTIGGTTLAVGTPLTLETGTPYMVTVTGASNWRGIMARIGGGQAGIDTSLALSLLAGETELKENLNCPGTVGGITQTFGRVDKTTLSFMMEFDEPSDGMMLDMNIVQSNPGPSVFFYDSFEINVIFPPTPVPTMAPVTGTPTGTPTSLPTMMPTTATPTMAPTPLRNIYEIGVGNDSIVAELALQAGLADALSDPNATLTLLAPDNSAFEALPPKITAFLTANTTILQGILLGHVLGIVADSTLVASLDGQEVTFLSGSMATVNVTDAGITVGEATVTTPDILASNGIVHIVDRIIGLPTILEGVAVFAGALVQAFNAARLSEEVDALNGVTLFAPTTAGFLGLAAQFSDLTGAVLTNDGFVLHSRAILSAHIFPDVAFSFDLMDGMNLTMLDGSTVTVSIDDLVQLSPGSGPGGMAAVVAFDIPTTQGVVHGIDAVITPSFLFTSAFDVASMLTPTLASLLVSAGLESAVASTFGITVFAPEDSALEGVTLTGDALVAVLSYHVVPAVIPSINIADGETAGVPTLLTGSTLSVVKDAMGVTINGVAMVIAADKLASNGIVHVIDAVLFPPVSTAVPTTMPTAPSAAAPVTMTMAAAAVLAALALC